MLQILQMSSIEECSAHLHLCVWHDNDSDSDKTEHWPGGGVTAAASLRAEVPPMPHLASTD